MFSWTINASATNDVRINGSTAHKTARHERKAMKHSSDTTRYTPSNIRVLALFTTMLVALSIPALPAAIRNVACSSLYFSAKAAVVRTTDSRVSAL
ncbi:hypothetical protein D3C85_1723550 [compost metagenome]